MPLAFFGGKLHNNDRSQSILCLLISFIAAQTLDFPIGSLCNGFGGFFLFAMVM